MNRFQKQSFADVLQNMFSWRFCKFHRKIPLKRKFLWTPFFTEQLQWLPLTFNSYFQRRPERKPVRLSAINTRFSWKNILSYSMFFVRYFYLKKSLSAKSSFINVVQTSSDVSPSLRLLLKVWFWYRCQNRIEKYYLNTGWEKKNVFVIFVHVFLIRNIFIRNWASKSQKP